MAKLVLVCGVRLAAGAWQLCEERREFGTGTSLRAASTRGQAQCPAPRHGRPGRGVRLPSDTPFIQHPQETRSGLLSPTTPPEPNSHTITESTPPQRLCRASVGWAIIDAIQWLFVSLNFSE